jgi:ABC-type multidrug transport system ATPase subunit
MQTLRSLANQGRTIITSIHQPNSQVFQSFDKLLLLCDGFIVYSGAPKDAIGYFASLGYECPGK